jgi:catechol 2,3-dioxygenase-like lactoylglutathione lyase family enzyme
MIVMQVLRIVTNLGSAKLAGAEKFYGEVLGMKRVMDHGWIKTYASPAESTVQISVATEGGSGTAVPDVSIEVDDVDEAHTRMVNAGFVIEYGLVDEPWGVRRFYVRDPFNKLINILSHCTTK